MCYRINKITFSVIQQIQIPALNPFFIIIITQDMNHKETPFVLFFPLFSPSFFYSRESGKGDRTITLFYKRWHAVIHPLYISSTFTYRWITQDQVVLFIFIHLAAIVKVRAISKVPAISDAAIMIDQLFLFRVRGLVVGWGR